MTTDILIHTEAGVSTLTINRLSKKNSITSAMYGMLADASLSAFTSFEGDHSACMQSAD